MSNGSMEIRENETIDIPFDFYSGLGNSITIQSATVGMIRDVDRSVVFASRPVTSTNYPIASTGQTLYSWKPSDDSILVGEKVIISCRANVVSGPYTMTKHCVVTITVIDDWA